MGKESLDDLLVKNETSPKHYVKSRLARIVASAKRYIGLSLVAGLLAVNEYSTLPPETSSQARNLSQETPFHLNGTWISWDNQTRKIYFQDPKVFKELENLISVCNITEKGIVESKNRDYVLLVVTPKNLKHFADSSKILKKSLDLQILDPTDNHTDIFLLSKDGSKFTNLTANRANDSRPSWIHFDQKVHFVSDRSGVERYYASDMKGRSKEVLMRKKTALNSIAIYLFGLATGIACISLYDRFRRKKTHSFVETMRDNKCLSTLTHAAAFSAAWYYFDCNITNVRDVQWTLGFTSYVPAVGATSFLSYFFWNHLSKINPPYLANSCKYYMLLANLSKKNKEQRGRIYESLKPVFRNKDMLDAAFEDILPVGKRFRFSERSIERVISTGYSSSQKVELFFTEPAVFYLTNLISSLKPGSLHWALGRFEMNLARENYSDCIRSWENIIRPPPRYVEMVSNLRDLNCLYASFIDTLGRQLNHHLRLSCLHDLANLRSLLIEELRQPTTEKLSVLLRKKSEVQWQRTVDLIMQDDELSSKFELKGESRNETLEYIPTEFFRGKLIFKRSKEHNLQKEFENLQYFNRRFKSGIPQQLAYLSKDKYNYLVMRHSGGVSLDAVVEKIDYSLKMGLFRKMNFFLNNLYEEAEGMTLQDVVKQDNDYYTRRVSEVFIQQCLRYDMSENLYRLKSVFLEHFGPVNLMLQKGERVFYKDANLRNWDIDKSGDLIALDFEGNSRKCLQLDLVSMYEFGREYLSQCEKQELIRDFVSQRERITGKPISVADFSVVWEYARVQRHLEMVGYRARDYFLSNKHEENSYGRYHLSSAKDALENIIKNNLCEKDSLPHLIEIRESLGCVLSGS